jgi:hypothetical protein
LNLLLDVGNDQSLPWEWSTSDVGFKRERVWSDPSGVLAKLNRILRSGCDDVCVGCYKSPDNVYCYIPFVFRHNGIAGDLTVDDILFSYWVASTIADVPYGARFRFSEGGNWTVRYDLEVGGVGRASYFVPPECNYRCQDILYESGVPPSGADALDAVDDAMYRLLDQKLDVNPKDSSIEKLDVDHNGVPDTYFDPDHMWFDAEDRLGVQSLWGPTVFKLVVWMG